MLLSIYCVGGHHFLFYPQDVTFLIIFLHCTRTYISLCMYMSMYANMSTRGASFHGVSICVASIFCTSIRGAIIRSMSMRYEYEVTSRRNENLIREHGMRMWYEHMIQEHGTITWYEHMVRDGTSTWINMWTSTWMSIWIRT